MSTTSFSAGLSPDDLIMEMLRDSRSVSQKGCAIGSAHERYIRSLVECYQSERLSTAQARSALESYSLPRPVIDTLQRILSLVELVGERRHTTAAIHSPQDVFDRFRSLAARSTETLRGVFCNVKNQVVRSIDVSVGTHNTVLCAPAELLHHALRLQTPHIVLVHNHPSGDPAPSEEDLCFTKKIQQAVQIMGLRLLDHVIIGGNSYFSFKKQGLL